MSVRSKLKFLKPGLIIPLVVYYIILPLTMRHLHPLGPTDAKFQCMYLLQILLPSTSLIWTIQYSAFTIASQGNELLYLHSKIKFPGYFGLFALNMILLVPIYILAKHLCYLDNYNYEYLRCFLICLLLHGMYYFCTYFTGNYLISNIILIGYIALGTFTGESGELWRLFESPLADKDLILCHYLGFGIVGIVAFLLGIIFNINYEKYT